MREIIMAKIKKIRFDRKFSFIPFFITIAAAIAARTYQLIAMTDLNSGVYYDRSIFKDYPVLIIAAGLIITALCLIFGSSEDKVVKSVIMINPMHQPLKTLNQNFGGVAGGICLGAGALIAAEFAMILGMARNETLERIKMKELDVPTFSGVGAADWVMLGFMLLAVITLMITAMNLFKGEGISAGNCFFLLSVPIWKIIQCFTIVYEMQKETRILILYSEKLYIIIADMCIAMLMFRVVRVFASMEDKHARVKMIFWGYATAVVTLTSSIPRFIALFVVPFQNRVSLTLPDLSDIGFAAFAIAVIMPFFSAFSYREMPKISYSQRNAQVALADIPESKQVMDEMDFNNIDTSTLNGK
jgi:hypothetical protein